MSERRTTCAAWDGGAIASVLGPLAIPQTTKTKCGRRRIPRSIDNSHPTCPRCRKLIDRERRALERVERELGIR